MLGVLEINGLERVKKELVDAEKSLVIVRVEVGIDMPNTAQKNVPNNSQSHRDRKCIGGHSECQARLKANLLHVRDPACWFLSQRPLSSFTSARPPEGDNLCKVGGAAMLPDRHAQCYFASGDTDVFARP
jgi:hypothetical protein